MRLPRSGSRTRSRTASATRAAESRRSSRWSSTRGSTACSARRRSCAAPSPSRRTTRRTAQRSADRSSEQPLMQNVLADLCLDSEAATATALRLARAFDEGDHAFRRLATAVAKYWVCKATPPLVAEALECLGGNGYVEESGMPRLYRESPVNSVWEGSGNVNCLDVLRALGARAREPEMRSWPSSTSRAARTGTSTRRSAALDRSARRCRRGGRPPARRAARARVARPRCSCATRRTRSPTPSARRGSAARAAARTGPSRRSVDAAAIVERHRPRLGE